MPWDKNFYAGVTYCEHAILPSPGGLAYKGVEICPFCRSTAPMGTTFVESGGGQEKESKDDNKEGSK